MSCFSYRAMNLSQMTPSLSSRAVSRSCTTATALRRPSPPPQSPQPPPSGPWPSATKGWIHPVQVRNRLSEMDDQPLLTVWRPKATRWRYSVSSVLNRQLNNSLYVSKLIPWCLWKWLLISLGLLLGELLFSCCALLLSPHEGLSWIPFDKMTFD